MEEVAPVTGSELHRWAPSVELRDAVVRFTGYAEHAGMPLQYVELPPTFVAGILNVGSA